MSFAEVRAVVESKVFEVYQNLNPPVEVVFDNTYETPPELPYVVCLVSYSSTTEPVICPGGGALERLLGNLQLSCYAPRSQGMRPLESLAAQGMVAMNTLYDPEGTAKVKCGQINGPTPVLSGTDPYALITLSCSFSAIVRT